MAQTKYVAYCGLYCKHCSMFARIPQQARDLYDTLKREGYEYFGSDISPRFNDFWKYLQDLTEFDKKNLGCRGDCGDPNCQIRLCAKEKNQEICVYCADYPCSKVLLLAKRYPALLGEGAKLKEIGIDAWILEQEERCNRGYCFSDGRYDA